MSMDRSLKSRGALTRHRNVLKRTERIEILEDEQRWDSTQSVFALPKVAHRKSTAGHKAKKAETPAEAEPGAEAPSEAAEPAQQKQEKPKEK